MHESWQVGRNTKRRTDREVSGKEAAADIKGRDGKYLDNCMNKETQSIERMRGEKVGLRKKRWCKIQGVR